MPEVEWISRANPYSGSGGVGIPGFVTFDDMPSPTDSSFCLGVGGAGPVTVDLDSESPHVLVNAPTGLGKSAVARSMAVQRLSQGDVLVVLDRKMHSHRWARELSPVAHYADTTESIGSALLNLGAELERRNRVVRDFRGPLKDAPVGPRVTVVFEETNATLAKLKALDKSSGANSLESFADLLFMGRAVKMHVVAFAQLASYRSGMTADLLENFGTKVLIGHSEKGWRWLVPECGRFRPAPVGAGRGLVCQGNRVREVQLAWMPEESAAEFVLDSPLAQRRARDLAGSRRRLPPVWRSRIGR